eukprot:761721-Hanusia_phi.AAC.4
MGQTGRCRLAKIDTSAIHTAGQTGFQPLQLQSGWGRINSTVRSNALLPLRDWVPRTLFAQELSSLCLSAAICATN